VAPNGDRLARSRRGKIVVMAKVCRNPECPEAQADSDGEYRDEISVCPRCGHPLEPVGAVAAGFGRRSSTRPESDDAVELVELCVAVDPIEATLIEGLLQSAGIQYLMTDPVDTGFGGWGRIIVGPGSFVGRARFVVSAEDLDEARALLLPSGDGGDATG